MFQMKVAAGYYDHVMTALNKIKGSLNSQGAKEVETLMNKIEKFSVMDRYDVISVKLCDDEIKSIFDFMSMYIRCFPESKTGELPTMTDTQFSGRLIEKRTQWLLSQDNK